MKANDYIIRLEKQEDHRAVEHLVREAFWNDTVRDAASIMSSMCSGTTPLL